MSGDRVLECLARHVLRAVSLCAALAPVQTMTPTASGGLGSTKPRAMDGSETLPKTVILAGFVGPKGNAPTLGSGSGSGSAGSSSSSAVVLVGRPDPSRALPDTRHDFVVAVQGAPGAHCVLVVALPELPSVVVLAVTRLDASGHAEYRLGVPPELLSRLPERLLVGAIVTP